MLLGTVRARITLRILVVMVDCSLLRSMTEKEEASFRPAHRHTGTAKY